MLGNGMTLQLMVNRWVELVLVAVVLVAVVLEAVALEALVVVALEALALAEIEAHTCNLKG